MCGRLWSRMSREFVAPQYTYCCRRPECRAIPYWYLDHWYLSDNTGRGDCGFISDLHWLIPPTRKRILRVGVSFLRVNFHFSALIFFKILINTMKKYTFNCSHFTDAKQKLTFAYSQAQDYPVDLYYLMDLSRSMKNDKEKLSTLGSLLSSTMRNITSKFRIGFGSFVDKLVMPYVSTVPKK